jgi:hypothetical protein
MRARSGGPFWPISSNGCVRPRPPLQRRRPSRSARQPWTDARAHGPGVQRRCTAHDARCTGVPGGNGARRAIGMFAPPAVPAPRRPEHRKADAPAPAAMRARRRSARAGDVRGVSARRLRAARHPRGHHAALRHRCGPATRDGGVCRAHPSATRAGHHAPGPRCSSPEPLVRAAPPAAAAVCVYRRHRARYAPRPWRSRWRCVHAVPPLLTHAVQRAATAQAALRQGPRPASCRRCR